MSRKRKFEGMCRLIWFELRRAFRERISEETFSRMAMNLTCAFISCFTRLRERLQIKQIEITKTKERASLR